MESVENQTVPPREIIRYHGQAVHQCRNHAALLASSNHLIFLDGDDELEQGYVEAMMNSVNDSLELLYPRVRYVAEHIADPVLYPEPRTLTKVPIYSGNYMVIGTLIPRILFDKVGGFREFDAFEDWDLWIRCMKAGVESRLVEDAIYRAWTRPNSRNRVRSGRELTREILIANGVDIDKSPYYSQKPLPTIESLKKQNLEKRRQQAIDLERKTRMR
jgi:glycosyltransferase involved in cell wall biosynthesis